MKIVTEEIRNESAKNLYWTRIFFTSGQSEKTSIVLAAASKEYFEHSEELKDGNISSDILSQWLNTVINKWSKFEESILDREVYFDVYANNPEDESEGLIFLLQKK